MVNGKQILGTDLLFLVFDVCQFIGDIDGNVVASVAAW
jgi:hypothetical protein